MKIFLDFEFIDDGYHITLLSGGFVREDGEELYFETIDARHLKESLPTKKTQWLHDNVVPYFSGFHEGRDVIRRKVIEFCGPEPEFWGYYCEYDWVVLSQLYGPLIERPKHWPMRCNDTMQLFNMLGLEGKTHDYVPAHEREHHALTDARWTRDFYQFCIKTFGEIWG